MRRVFGICLWLGIMVVVVHAGWDADVKIPPHDKVREAVWRQMFFEDFLLEGNMRTEKNLYPIRLRTKNREMVYEFVEQPLQIRVAFTPRGTLIQHRKAMGKPWEALPHRLWSKEILDSDATYEDLAVDFLHWEDVKPLGGDSIKTLKAWAYEAKPDGKSAYAKVRYWVSADYLALLRVDALNAKDEVIKRVEINGVEHVEKTDSYVIKELMICDIIPGRDLSRSRTYIEIQDVKPGKSGLPD